MHPFWNNVVEYFPKWVAPNVMTFLGFLFTVLNFIILSYYDWGYWANSDEPGTSPVPDWVWIVAAFNIFVAYTLGELSFIGFAFNFHPRNPSRRYRRKASASHWPERSPGRTL